MALQTSSDRLMSDINVTPFVDVMLVLLIIFMVTAPMMMQGVDVALPEATAKPLESQKENLVVTIDKDQQVHINDFAVEADYLREKLMKILENRPDREVYFRADKSVPYGVVVKVMAEIKGAGVEKLGMVTVPIEEDRASAGKK
jgi:biopolymer transport protein TolR